VCEKSTDGHRSPYGSPTGREDRCPRMGVLQSEPPSRSRRFARFQATSANSGGSSGAPPATTPRTSLIDLRSPRARARGIY
jgi:hypothetical protein